MPDLERIMRKIELELCSSQSEREKLQAYHKGQDQARREILYVTLWLIGLFCFVFLLTEVVFLW